MSVLSSAISKTGHSHVRPRRDHLVAVPHSIRKQRASTAAVPAPWPPSREATAVVKIGAGLNAVIKQMELDALLQLLDAAEQGSFHRAGHKLNVRRSTVSRRIKTLEKRIGAKLLDRHRHGIHPTDAGTTFLESTPRMVSNIENLAYQRTRRPLR